MSNGDAHPHVTRVDLMADNSVVLTVQFDNFTANEPVEISGYVVQANGAYARFYLETIVSNHPSHSDGTVQVPVTIDTIAGLRATDELTVVTKVAKVWPTVLTGGYTPATPDVLATWQAQPAPSWGLSGDRPGD